jgi:hypothetical protein
MKPLNYDNSPCSPTSSNCVIWQGPNLDCIKLCTGDTISDVVANLATELCTIMSQLNISNYDLSCFNLVSCPPDTFQELVQFLITKICELENIDISSTNNNVSNCPDCIISVASCFMNDMSNTNGSSSTTMQLIDYVTLIGEEICNLIDQLAVINTQITNLTSITNSLQTQISSIQPYSLPKIALTTPIDIYPINAQVPVDALLKSYINDVWGPYVTATGSNSEIINAVYQKTILNSTLQLANGQPFLNKASWISDVVYNSSADALNNIWSVIDDVFFYVSSQNISTANTKTVDLNLSGIGVITANINDTGWVNLDGFNLYMNNTAGTLYSYPQVRRIGNVLHFKGDIVIPLATSYLGTTVNPWVYTAGISSYETSIETQPFISTGGVILNSDGIIQFNVDAGSNPVSVIPSSVIATYVIDDNYTTGYKVFTRNIEIASNTSSMLSSLMSINISTTGILSLKMVKNAEKTLLNTSANALNTSHLNTVISHVVAGEYVPKYDNVTNILHSSSVNSTNVPIEVSYKALDGGTYSFECNANDENQVGGFTCKLDGLTVFLTP